MSKPSITLRDMGSFHVGGRIVEISGKPETTVTFSAGGVPARVDRNGAYLVEAMYVQYFLPEARKGKYPLLMWHGGGLSGVTYETTPDGHEGWLTLFLRKGWDIYNSDAVERGRSGFAPPDVWPSEPHFVSMADAFIRHRIGAAWSDDVRFPLEADVRVRARHEGERALIEHLADADPERGEAVFVARFREPVRAISPGQVAVAYLGDRVLGGGVISAAGDGLR